MIEAALNSVDRGLDTADRSGEGWYLPELYRLKGALLLEASDESEGIEQLDLALDLARKKSAKWFELRTSTSLAAYLVARGDVRKARELLSPICDWFTEGSQTPDLKHATELLWKIQHDMG